MITRDMYPELFAPIDDAALDRAQRQVASFTTRQLADWTCEHTVTYEVAEQPYRMIVERGESDQVIIAGGELGVGSDSLGSAARLLTIRALVDEQATVILQPNTTLRESNTNFSKEELGKLGGGDPAPMVDRMRRVLDYVNGRWIVGFGPSQGGVTMLAVAAHPDVQPVATAVIETPNVIDRSLSGLTRDFLGAGSRLKDNIRSNFASGSAFADDLVAGMSLWGTARYLAGLTRPDNRALAGLMRRYTASRQMKQILDKGGSVAHAWATEDAVSPRENNRVIAAIFGPGAYDGRYYPFEITDNDHSVTNQYLVSAALVRRARDVCVR